ncbi:MAG: hypothetical protein Q9169_000479 [Polycauliona sp. 2 TL-2023]
MSQSMWATYTLMVRGRDAQGSMKEGAENVYIVGTPLTYAPALGIPDSLRRPPGRYARSYAYGLLDIPLIKPDYRKFHPIRVLHMYDSLSNAPYILSTANIETKLLQRPLPDDLELDHQLRIQTLERWWEVKSAQRKRGNESKRGDSTK